MLIISVFIGVGIAWLLTVGAWFVTRRRHMAQRDALTARLRVAGQKLAASEQARQGLMSQVDAQRVELEKLRTPRRPDVPNPGPGRRPSPGTAWQTPAPVELSVNGARLSGNGFEDTQILRP